MAQAKPPLVANVTELDLEDHEGGIEFPEDDNDVAGSLPPDFALLGSMGTKPRSLDKALHGPNTKEWQAVFDYEISQLEKLGTWVIKDLPQGHTAIPCIGFKKGFGSNVWVFKVQNCYEKTLLRAALFSGGGFTGYDSNLSLSPEQHVIGPMTHRHDTMTNA